MSGWGIDLYKSNVVDMAVGVVIGAAFGKIVTSLVGDLIMPTIGVLSGGIDFSNFVIELKPTVGTSPAVVISYGKFLQTIFDFIIVAAAMFTVITLMNVVRCCLFSGVLWYLSHSSFDFFIKPYGNT